MDRRESSITPDINRELSTSEIIDALKIHAEEARDAIPHLLDALGNEQITKEQFAAAAGDLQRRIGKLNAAINKLRTDLAKK